MKYLELADVRLSMKNKTATYIEKLLQYALNEKNELVYIDYVSNGLDCNCVCPACHGNLIAKQGDVKEHHFAHVNADCKHGYETSLHLLAKEIFSEKNPIRVPRYAYQWWDYKKDDVEEEIWIKSELIYPDKVYTEQYVEDFIPDIVIEKNGHKLIVEIYVTHIVDEAKLQKIKSAKIPAIEIDLSQIDRNITKQDLIQFFEDGNNINWLYHPVIEEKKIEKELEETEKMIAEEIAKKNKELGITNLIDPETNERINKYPIYGDGFNSKGWIYKPPCPEYTTIKNGDIVKFIGSNKMYCDKCPYFYTIEYDQVKNKNYLYCKKGSIKSFVDI